MIEFLQFLRNRFSSLLWWFFLFLSIGLLVQKNFYYRVVFKSKTNQASLSLMQKSNNFKSYFELRKTNKDLMEENEVLRNRLNKINQTRPIPVNELDLIDEEVFEVLAAKVIFNTIRKNNNYFIIQKGSKDGILPNMGVVSNKGIVGITETIASNYSLCRSVLNSKFTTNPKINGINYFGEVKWTKKGYNKMYITEIGKESKIQSGDFVTTSNFSSIFNENVPIGIVGKVVKKKENNYLQIECLLAANLKKLNYVYVLKRKDKEEIDQLIELSSNEH